MTEDKATSPKYLLMQNTLITRIQEIADDRYRGSFIFATESLLSSALDMDNILEDDCLEMLVALKEVDEQRVTRLRNALRLNHSRTEWGIK